MTVFLCEHIHEEARKKLSQHARIVSDWDRVHECDALINRNLQITAQVMERAAALKVIAIHGTGTDGVDLQEAERRGIKVVYAPHRNAVSVAEHTAGLVLAVARMILPARSEIDAGGADALRAICGLELRGKLLGLVGLGAVGRQLAHIFREGFGMKIIAYSPSLTPEKAASLKITFASSLSDILSVADVVCICAPLTSDTRGMMDSVAFSQMKPGSILVNSARGAIVDEMALCEALQSGRLFGAASDVFAVEPIAKDHPLLRLPNFVATPHVAGNTVDALRRLGFDCVDQILEVLAGHMPQFPLVGF